MNRFLERTYVSVNLKNIIDNAKLILERNPGSRLLAVVKADAYGHGAVQVAKALMPYAWGFAVAIPEEAIALREGGVTSPILILGTVSEEWYEDMIMNEVRIPLFTMEQAEAFSNEAKRLGKTGLYHVKVDTGMNRIGLYPDDDGFEICLAMKKLPCIEGEGIFTHLVEADTPDTSFSERQIRIFLNFKDRLSEAGCRYSLCHYANSSASALTRMQGSDLLRYGIALYGLKPSLDVDWSYLQLKPALSWKTRVRYIKLVQPGNFVGYGRTYEVKKPTMVATLPVGYGDGYPRGLTNRGEVLIHGKRCPVLGRVCMDQVMVDVTAVQNVAVGDIVTLIGQDGEESITLEELAETAERFHYELPCQITARVPRVYVNEDQ